jgi:hypothetical protein
MVNVPLQGKSLFHACFGMMVFFSKTSNCLQPEIEKSTMVKISIKNENDLSTISIYFLLKI